MTEPDDRPQYDRAEYDKWYRRADLLCTQLSGLSLDDLPDGPSYDRFRDGISPIRYAREILRKEGFPFNG